MKAQLFDNRESLIGTLTFQDALNYGALLQCYALQRSIMKLGYSTEVLNYASPVIRSSNWPRKVTSASSPREVAKIVAKRHYLKRRKRSFDAFKADCIALSDEFSAEMFIPSTRRYSKIIVGSDQVWNPVLTHEDMHYFLAGINTATKKASYAASVGLSEIPGDIAEEIKELLTGFCAITVREEAAARTLGMLMGVQPEVVCDPVMLLERSDWDSLMGDGNSGNESFVLYYSLGLPDVKIIEKCREYAGDRGLGLVVLHNSPAVLRNCVSDNSCDPRQWLRYFRDAETVVTPSFHGVCFSLIFQKRFICVKNQKNADVSSRIINLLNRFDLREQRAGDFAAQARSGIDWAHVSSILEKERTKGTSRLKSILEL